MRVTIKVYYQDKLIKEFNRDTLESASKLIDIIISKLESETKQERVILDPTEASIGEYSVRLAFRC